MSAIEDIKKEIIRSHQVPVPDSNQEKTPKKPKSEKKAMTKAEIEAYRQKMMEREEARYLGKQPKPKKSEKAGKSGKSGKTSTDGPKPRKESGAKTEEKVQKVKKVQKSQKDPSKMMEMPKMLKPLVPLYLLHIPGLPKGDGIVICYAEGIQQ